MASSAGLHTPTGPAGWRRTFGVGLFILHLVLPLVALLFVPLLGLPSGVNTVLLGLSMAGGPDVLLVASIAILGKDGVAELMGKLGSVVKRVTRWDSVDRRRYTIGLWVLVISTFLPLLILLFYDESIESVGGGPGWAFYVLLASTFAFIGAVLSMGAPLWSRIEAIFTWDAEIVLPDKEEQAATEP